MAVARIAQLEHVPQISFSATSPKLSDNISFPYFFRTVAPDGLGGKLTSNPLCHTVTWAVSSPAVNVLYYHLGGKPRLVTVCTGGVGALVQLFRSFDWSTITILHTDKTWAQDTASSFRSAWVGAHPQQIGTGGLVHAAWTGTVAYYVGIETLSDGSVDMVWV